MSAVILWLHYRSFRTRLPGRRPAARLSLPENPMVISSTLRRNRLIALIAAVAMVAVICGYTAQTQADRPSQPCHCDWTMHFTGVAGSAPHPAPIAKPVLATRVTPTVAAAAPRSLRRLRAHLARAPPPTLSVG